MELEAWLAILLPLAVAGVAAWGARSVQGLVGLVSDPRLVRLSWFLWLFAAAWSVHAVGVVLFERATSDVIERAAFDVHDLLFLTHHGLLVAAMGFAALVYRPPPRPSGTVGDRAHAHPGSSLALAPLLFWLEPTLRLVEAAGFFYLLVRTALNHGRRRDLGSFRVALGFLFLLAGHAWLLYLHLPLGPHDVYGDLLALAGVVLIVSSLPRRRA